MSDLLVHFNIPFWISISLLVASSILNIVLAYLLSKSKSKFDNNLQLLSEFQKEKYLLIKNIYHYLAEIYHCVYRIQDGDLEYENKLKKELKNLRKLSRENILILGDSFRDIIKIYSDNIQAIPIKELNLHKLLILEEPIRKNIENIETNIPAVNILKKHKKRQ